jgi:hypothetical protein
LTRLAIRNARARYRRVQRIILNFYKGVKDLKKLVELMLWAKQDLQFWAALAPKDCQLLFRYLPLHQLISLVTDTSDTGWGYVLRGLVRMGAWSTNQLHLPIAIKEFLEVKEAVKDNKRMITAQYILWEVDSQTVQLYWRNQGGVKNVPLCCQVLDLLLWCQARGTLVVTKWVRSEENLYPDLLSRGWSVPDWHLCPRVVSLIFKRLGTPLIDLMATSYSTQLPATKPTSMGTRGHYRWMQC